MNKMMVTLVVMLMALAATASVVLADVPGIGPTR